MPEALSTKAVLRLRLYVAGDAPNSLLAIANARALFAEHVDAGSDIEIVDLLEYPERALADGIIVTPTLLKMCPPPIQRVVGNLSDSNQVLLALGTI